MVHDSTGYEVEFVRPNGKTIAVVPVSAEIVRPASAVELFEYMNAERFQQRVADIAITSLVARNQGFAGPVETARTFLAKMNLRDFGLQSTESDFLRLLDEKTAELQQQLKGRRAAAVAAGVAIGHGKKAAARAGAPELWGTARKALNVFLCEAYFHRVLHRCFGLLDLGPWLEVPLDSILYKAIYSKARKLGLRKAHEPDLLRPDEFRVGRLRETTSRRAQELAQQIAQREHLPARIYLEINMFRASDKAGLGGEGPATGAA